MMAVAAAAATGFWVRMQVVSAAKPNNKQHTRHQWGNHKPPQHGRVLTENVSPFKDQLLTLSLYIEILIVQTVALKYSIIVYFMDTEKHSTLKNKRKNIQL